MFPFRNLSSFRAALKFAHCACKPRISHVHKNNFHRCTSLYEKREELHGHAREYMYEKSDTTAELEEEAPQKKSSRQPFARLTGRYQLVYTCKKCNMRNTAVISKIAYHHGAVVASCSGCRENHLIADNLKWFSDKKQNIEDIMKEKGESVTKITAHDLSLEVVPPDAPEPIPREEIKKLPPLTL